MGDAIKICKKIQLACSKIRIHQLWICNPLPQPLGYADSYFICNNKFSTTKNKCYSARASKRVQIKEKGFARASLLWVRTLSEGRYYQKYSILFFEMFRIQNLKKLRWDTVRGKTVSKIWSNFLPESMFTFINFSPFRHTFIQEILVTYGFQICSSVSEFFTLYDFSEYL